MSRVSAEPALYSASRFQDALEKAVASWTLMGPREFQEGGGGAMLRVIEVSGLDEACRSTPTCHQQSKDARTARRSTPGAPKHKKRRREPWVPQYLAGFIIYRSSMWHLNLT